MTQGEIQTIRNVIRRLRCEPRPNGQHRESNEVREALLDYHAKMYLETWIIGALECLLPEGRDVSLGIQLSE